MKRSLSATAVLLGAVLFLAGCTAEPVGDAPDGSNTDELIFVKDEAATGTYEFDFAVAGPEDEKLAEDTITIQGEDANLMEIMDWYFEENGLNFVHDSQVVSTLLDLESDKDQGWIVYVNDEMAQVGAADLVPAAGDSVEWRYVKYSELEF